MRGRSSLLLSICGALALSTGCSWVTTAERTNQLNCLDQDGDGAVAAADLCDQDDVIDDCNDSPASGANEVPGAEEVPYDGWDNDCGRLNNERQPDLVDVDGDGYPGILREDWEQVASSTVSWPGGLRETVDCDDTRDDVNPSAVDRPYDGVDADCQGDDDYDQDDDGFVPDPADIEDMPGYVPYTGDKPSGDCYDYSALFYPGAEDAPYDGENRDCGDGDDYDADGDGHQSADYVGAGTDCDDSDPSINPDAADAPYDGVDSDCGGEDDYDQDADGYIPDTFAGTYTGSLPAGDCNDVDPEVHPGNLEVFLDGKDQDCDGGDGALFVEADQYTITGPRRPKLRALDDQLWLSLSGSSVSSRQEVLEEGGMALVFPKEPGPDAQPISHSNWRKDTKIPMIGDFDVEASSDGIVWAFTQDGGGTGDHRLVMVYGTVADGGVVSSTSLYEVSGRFDVAPMVSTEVSLHNNSLVAVACGADEAIYARADLGVTGPTLVDGGDASIGCEHLMLLHSGSSDQAHLDLSGGQSSYTLGEGAMTDAADRYSLTGISAMQSHGGLGVIALSPGGVVLDDGSTSSTHLSSYSVLEADAVEVDGLFYVAAIVEEGGSRQVVLAEIDGGSEQVVELDWSDGLDPHGVTVEATSTRLMVAAVGSDGSSTEGSLYWSVMQR